MVLLIAFTGYTLMFQQDYVDANDHDQAMRMTWGNICCWSSCFMYALYTNVICTSVAKVGDANWDMTCFLGFVGLFCATINFVLLVIFNYIGWETFEWPPKSSTWICMTMYAIQGFTMEYCWAKAAVNLGPVACVSFYTILTFPITIWFDVVVVDEPVVISTVYIIGCSLILLAFTVITILD